MTIKRFAGGMIISLFAIAATAGVAMAQSGGSRLVGADDPDELISVLKGFGSAELEPAKNGDPRVVGRIEGVRYIVNFYGCKDNSNCRNLQFRAWWQTAQASRKPSLANVNDWNIRKIFGKAYIDKQGDTFVEMPIVLQGKTTLENFEKEIEMWRLVLRQFQEEVIK